MDWVHGQVDGDRVGKWHHPRQASPNTHDAVHIALDACGCCGALPSQLKHLTTCCVPLIPDRPLTHPLPAARLVEAGLLDVQLGVLQRVVGRMLGLMQLPQEEQDQQSAKVAAVWARAVCLCAERCLCCCCRGTPPEQALQPCQLCAPQTLLLQASRDLGHLNALPSDPDRTTPVPSTTPRWHQQHLAGRCSIMCIAGSWGTS